VLWFDEVRNRRLYWKLGYSSIYHYAQVALGFSNRKTAYFVKLSESLERLPALKESVATGELGWTKACEVAKVADGRNEKKWIRKAQSVGRRELARDFARDFAHEVAQTKNQAKMAKTEQMNLEVVDSKNITPASVPVTYSLRFTAEQFARFEALVEKVHKNGKVPRGTSKEDLILATLDELASCETKKCSRLHFSSCYQITVYRCEECGTSKIETSREPPVGSWS
jgi:hypothetical protein